MVFEHKPVMLKEVLEYLECRKNGVYIDGTLGRGGHTEAILHELDNTGRLNAIDRDITAIEEVRKKLGDRPNLILVHDVFTNIPDILERTGYTEVDGMIFDLGVSSPQFDNPESGFSYNYNAALDMRMDQEQSLTAA